MPVILSATLSKPTGRVEEILGRKYERVKIRFTGGTDACYFAELFTAAQSFHKHWTEAEAEEFVRNNVGAAFLNCVERTEEKEIVWSRDKKGKTRRVERLLPQAQSAEQIAARKNSSAADWGAKSALFPGQKGAGGQRDGGKNYFIKEGEAVPFLQALGVMTDSGKAVSAKYGKFRQVNRFLELLDDALPRVLRLKAAEGARGQDFSQDENCSQGKEAAVQKRPRDENLSQGQNAAQDFSQDKNRAASGGNSLQGQNAAPLQILDFGSGKSYLTFAVQYFFERVKKIPCQITAVDLKEDVIKNCANLAARLGIKNMRFVCGDIASYQGAAPDIVISLHACDTATDGALDFAARKRAKAILCVPCCQRELNSQLSKNSNADFAALLKYGIFRERFAALLTDAARAELLEARGYSVQVLEFIDMEGTPKNLMIRAALKDGRFLQAPGRGAFARPKLLEAFGLKHSFFDLTRAAASEKNE